MQKPIHTGRATNSRLTIDYDHSMTALLKNELVNFGSAQNAGLENA